MISCSAFRSPGSKVIVVMAISLLAVTCHKKPPRPVVAPPVYPQPTAPVPPPPVLVPSTWPELPLPPSSLPAPPEPPLPKDFRDAEAYFRNGNYAEAYRAYDRYVREDPIVLFRDSAMFKMGMSAMLVCSTADCRVKAQEPLKRLVARFPQSPYTAEARFILGLQNEIDRWRGDVKARDDKIQKLTDELDRLKKIDLGRKTTPVKK